MTELAYRFPALSVALFILFLGGCSQCLSSYGIRQHTAAIDTTSCDCPISLFLYFQNQSSISNLELTIKIDEEQVLYQQIGTNRAIAIALCPGTHLVDVAVGPYRRTLRKEIVVKEHEEWAEITFNGLPDIDPNDGLLHLRSGTGDYVYY